MHTGRDPEIRAEAFAFGCCFKFVQHQGGSNDSVRFLIQPAWQVPAATLVSSHFSEGEEANLPRARLRHFVPEVADVSLFGVQGHKGSLQALRQSLLLCGN